MTNAIQRLLLSLDPGTHKLGWALWEDYELWRYGVFTQRKGDLWTRIAILQQELTLLFFAPDEVACEDPEGFRDRAQRPLSLMTGVLAGWARMKKATWHPYHQSTIKASCCPRGMPRNKNSVRVAMESFYPQCVGAPEDAIDAIATGHTHIAHMHEKAIEEVLK